MYLKRNKGVKIHKSQWSKIVNNKNNRYNKYKFQNGILHIIFCIEVIVLILTDIFGTGVLLFNQLFISNNLLRMIKNALELILFNNYKSSFIYVLIINGGSLGRCCNI